MILVFGSLNVDLVVRVKALPRPGETVLGPSYDVVAGGKGANQALAAARAGAETAMVGAVGSDDFAKTALAELEIAGVDLEGVARQGPRTGAAFITVDRKGENECRAWPRNQSHRQVPIAGSSRSAVVLLFLTGEVNKPDREVA